MAYYKRYLPHWQPTGAQYFITFRLAGSLPKEVVVRIRNERTTLLKKTKNKIHNSGILPEEQRGDEKELEGSDKMSNLRKSIDEKIFTQYESVLDTGETGPTWLKEEKIVRIVENALHFYDDHQYDLYAYCIMSNHVHLVFKHIGLKSKLDESPNDYPITKILHSIKSYSALKCNKTLNRTGTFWQSESYDRVIRDQNELENTIRYTLNNPVKIGLVNTWEEWPYSYCKKEFIETFKSI